MSAPEWDDEAWCAHGGHVDPDPDCPWCPLPGQTTIEDILTEGNA